MDHMKKKKVNAKGVPRACRGALHRPSGTKKKLALYVSEEREKKIGFRSSTSPSFWSRRGVSLDIFIFLRLSGTLHPRRQRLHHRLAMQVSGTATSAETHGHPCHPKNWQHRLGVGRVKNRGHGEHRGAPYNSFAMAVWNLILQEEENLATLRIGQQENWRYIFFPPLWHWIVVTVGASLCRPSSADNLTNPSTTHLWGLGHSNPTSAVRVRNVPPRWDWMELPWILWIARDKGISGFSEKRPEQDIGLMSVYMCICICI